VSEYEDELGDGFSLVVGWCIIETFAYFSIISSTIMFLIIEQCKSICNKDRHKEDVRAQSDIIRYSTRTLYWYAFNWLLIICPILLIYGAETDCLGTRTNGAYFKIMLILIANHIIMFIFMHDIMILVPH